MKKEKKAILVDVIRPSMHKSHSMERLEELEKLVNTYGGIVVVKTYQKRFHPHGRTFIGPGKAQMLFEEAKELGADLVIVNDMLKPQQIFNLSEIMQPGEVKVWDRIDLILKIFAKHATTTEAKLEIELASVRHMGPRIFGMGMELSRQAGGIGTVGIGETNTEIMKRHLKKREQHLKKQLEKYQNVRAGQRKNRKRQNLKIASLIGYTNAGKTTLMNVLTRSKNYADDKLFATLDTRVGKLYLQGLQRSMLVSDTIGFIKDLPPKLIHAFQSTLSEAIESDLLLILIDASDLRYVSKIKTVENILEELSMGEKPKIYIFNKMDASAFTKAKIELLREQYAEFNPVFISAEKKEGIEELIGVIEEKVE